MGRQEFEPVDLSIPIGSSSYTFSREAQKYLTKLDPFDFKGSSPVLIIQEPHFSMVGQINLFKGLEVFFRDNPSLVRKTAFLAEGYPANQLVSVLPLIEQEPNPSDDLIREVLGTFLITAYMAYEWKHQQGIPIIGTEDKSFYELSRDLDIAEEQNPGKLFAQVSYKDGTVIDVKFEHAEIFSYVIRNKSMIETLMEVEKDYENPILFVGYKHLRGLNETEFNFMKSFAEGGITSKFGPYASRVKAEAENGGILKYLAEKDIGFSILNQVGIEELDDKSREGEAYNRLFKTQQQGEWNRKSREEYKKYLSWLLSQRKTKSAVTTKPSPEAAAQYVKALKGGVIYEVKPNIKKGGWFQISKDRVRARLGKVTIWEKGISPRGGNYEKLREANLGSNCPVIDHFDAEKRTVTSLKTFDLRSDYYQDPKRIDYTIGGYIEELSEFYGVRWTAPGKTFRINIWRGANLDFQDRYLEVAIPAGSVTRAQRQKLLELQEYAATVDVILNIVEIS